MQQMTDGVRIVATGVRIDAHPDPEHHARPEHAPPEQPVDLVRWRAGQVAFVRLTSFVEFDDGSGVRRWEGTAQGPHAVSLAGSATSRLLELVETMPDLLLAELGISGLSASRFDFHAAPRRIDVDPGLAKRLTLD